MSTNDLATLAEAKVWLGLTTTANDAILTALITSVSRTILGYLNRTVIPTSRTELRDGTGGRKMMLSEWPVLAITNLNIDGSVITAQTSAPFGTGFIIDPPDDSPPGAMQRLSLAGGLCFNRGIMNVSITYLAGYMVAAEAQTIPTTPFQITAFAPYGDWANDQGVTYAATGAALTAVTGAPAAGQYQLAAGGKYTFAAADAGKGVLLGYGYIPAELKQATLEAVGERFKYRDRVGVNTKTLAGQETITFINKDLSDAVKMMLAPYQRVVQP